MILFKREYHRVIEVYHWSWMQAVSTFTFLMPGGGGRHGHRWNWLVHNYPDSLLSCGNLHP